MTASDDQRARNDAAIAKACAERALAHLNDAQRAAVSTITALMLALPWENREDVWRAVESNGVFCVHCGVGSPEHPNPRCWCENDD